MNRWVGYKKEVYTQCTSFSIKKEKKNPAVLTTCVNPDDMQNVIIKSRKTNGAWFHLYELSKIVKLIEARNRIPVASSWVEGGRQSC